MKFKNALLKLMRVLPLMLSSPLFAGGEIRAVEEVIKEYPFYVKVGAGASFSSKANIEVDYQFWDFSVDGYNDRLGNSEWYEFGLGYQFTPAWALEITGTTRPSYDYKKFQRSQGTSAPGFLGNKTRFFKLTNQSLMVNLMLDTQGVSDRFIYKLTQQSVLRPILGAGVGIAYNTVRDFHSEATSLALINPVSFAVASIMNDHTRSSIAYQLLAGIRLTCHERFNIDLGYRYFNGGNFSSNFYVVNVPTGLSTPITVSPWKGKLRAQEVFVNLSYAVF